MLLTDELSVLTEICIKMRYFCWKIAKSSSAGGIAPDPLTSGGRPLMVSGRLRNLPPHSLGREILATPPIRIMFIHEIFRFYAHSQSKLNNSYFLMKYTKAEEFTPNVVKAQDLAFTAKRILARLEYLALLWFNFTAKNVRQM